MLQIKPFWAIQLLAVDHAQLDPGKVVLEGRKMHIGLNAFLFTLNIICVNNYLTFRLTEASDSFFYYKKDAFPGAENSINSFGKYKQ